MTKITDPDHYCDAIRPCHGCSVGAIFRCIFRDDIVETFVELGIVQVVGLLERRSGVV